MNSAESRRANLLARYPVAAFAILATVLGGGTFYLVMWGDLPAAVGLAAAPSASIAGIVVTAVVDGRAGLKLMWKQLRIWRVGAGYWLFALFFLVLAILLGSAANPLFDGDRLSIHDIKPTLEIVPMFAAFFVLAGLGEELGFTGFLLPRLRARHSALASSAIRAAIAGLWHLPLFLYSGPAHPALASFPYPGWVLQKGFLVAMAAFLLLILLPWSILITWVFNSTRGSLLLVAVLHGSEVWVAYWMVKAGIDPGNLDNYWGYGAVLVVAAIVVVMATGPENLTRKGRRVGGRRVGEQYLP